ncbi:hypothetical protein [Flammeovirga kamogawensis]|uniref:Uncharacterized protein n=2 Tax=Flammeovirga kamogawensis TaxID=373891 RepID=A0ABX8GQS6_9BACT|nr:hypothetical protein [Flammeovirga kamogawensis]MBB6463452.1 hypothetical protein [Flammeovirga kamogawensis]QWG05622.1 hypothetical protein KM029_09520 [Flammeovirga kamogawensis]TRX67453.1 hypothetical protein EO216_04555 [Flammeovirga kamogawensis]
MIKTQNLFNQKWEKIIYGNGKILRKQQLNMYLYTANKRGHIKKVQLILLLFILMKISDLKGQDLQLIEKGTVILYRDKTLKDFHFNTKKIPVCKTIANYESINSSYNLYCVGSGDSITLNGKISPYLYIIRFGDGYVALSLNEKKEVMDLKHISYVIGMDSDEMISKVVDDTTLRVTYLDGYKRRVEKYTLVQRDGLFVKKDSSFTEPLPTFDEWEVFFGHYEYDED